MVPLRVEPKRAWATHTFPSPFTTARVRIRHGPTDLFPPSSPAVPVVQTLASRSSWRLPKRQLLLKLHSDSPGNPPQGLATIQGIFPTQGSNPHLMSPAVASEFFTTNATWKVFKVRSRVNTKILMPRSDLGCPDLLILARDNVSPLLQENTAHRSW